MNTGDSEPPTGTLEGSADRETLEHEGSARTAPGSDFPPGGWIDRYVVLQPLGKGGTGAVYAAYDSELDRRVALKFLRAASGAAGTEWPARMMREAKAMARISHPNVVTLYDAGLSEDGRVFLAMEIVEGGTLAEWLKAAPRSWREVVGVLCEAGAGLAAAHAAGMIHRDFTLHNVLIGKDGRPRVTDFGLVRSTEPSVPGDEPAPVWPTDVVAVTASPTSSGSLEKLTMSGAFLGTPGYMAPEQYTGDVDVDVRADIFAFSATLYRALYGERAFEGETVAQIATATVRGEVRPAPKGSKVPAWVHKAVLWGLATDVAARPASMHQLIAALRADPQKRRRRWILAGAALGIAGAAAVGWAHHRRAVREECAMGGGLMAEVWNAGVRDGVGASIRATGAPLADETARRAQSILDNWATGWASARRDACEATRVRGVESAATMDVRLACLDGERRELAALAQQLSHADVVATKGALIAAYQLPQPRACWEPNAARLAALPDDPTARASVLALHGQIAQVRALLNTGHIEGVEPLANAGIERARAIHDRESETQFLLLRAGCEYSAGKNEAALASDRDAFVAAFAAGDDSKAVLASAATAYELTGELKTHEAEQWLAIGRAALEHEGRDDRGEAELLEAEAVVAYRAADSDRVIALDDRAITALENAYGPSHPAIGKAIINRAIHLGRAGRRDEAIAETRRAIRIVEEFYGPDYPPLFVNYNNVGYELMILGRHDEAREALEHALSIGKALGDKSANAILVWTSMAQLDNRTGRSDAALADVERAEEIVRATGNDVAYLQPYLLVERGTALLAKGDAAGAHEACARALELQEKQGVVTPDKVYGDDALACLGQAELATGKVADAIAHLERSVTLTKREDPATLPLAELALARALRAARRDPDRARQLVHDALARLRSVPGVEAQAHAAEEWLAEEGAGR